MKPIEKQLDELWSKVIRQKGYCECCMSKNKKLNAHHIFTRSRKATRWEISNGLCLCAGCHTLSSTLSAHKTPVEFTRWLEEYKGKKWIDNLCKMSNSISKPTKSELEETKEYLSFYAQTKTKGLFIL